MKRIPVRHLGLPLMPMKQTKAYWLVKTSKAKFRYDRKIKLWYLKLLIEPSGYATQEITLGIDPGSTFDGFTLLSKLFHHLNVELIHRLKKGKNSVKSFKTRQSMNRRVRRSRLRHRPTRFDSRTSTKLVPSVKADIDFRKWLVTKLSSYFPITKIIIEDVKFNHYRDLVGKSRLSGTARGKYFSHVEVGKTYFYNWINSLGYTLELTEGYKTKESRVDYLGTDTKSLDKGEMSFEAHCLDSFVIAGKGHNLDFINLNKSVMFIAKIVKQRRSLTRTRADYKDKSKYFRYAKGGTKIYFTSTSNKLNKCRVKLKDSHSNHPKEWIYLDNGYSIKVKSNTARYGGTSFNNERKFYVNNQWSNRKIIT